MAKINILDILDIGTKVVDVLTDQAKKKTTDMTPADVTKVAPAITKQVEEIVAKQVQPILDQQNKVIENQTNNEPWWKSRILRGAFVTVVSTAWLAFEDFTDGSTPDMNTIITYGTTVFGALYVIYGRLTGKGTPAI